MRLKTLVCSAAIVAASSTAALAEPISALYVFGDSLSDNGNFSLAIQQAIPGPGPRIPAEPYAEGRASNGPVAVEYLAQYLGLGPLTPAALGGTNYAFIGAATGAVPLPGVPGVFVDNIIGTLGLPEWSEATGLGTGQLERFLARPGNTPIDPAALFFIWGGPNDIYINPSVETATAAADNIALLVDTLYGYGARRFFVPDMAALGSTPGGRANEEALNLLTKVFNAQLEVNLAALQARPGISLRGYDTNARLLELAVGARLTPCVTGNVVFPGMNSCGAEDEMIPFFWDLTHPTTQIYAGLAKDMAAEIGRDAEVPEPATLTLAALGLAAVAIRRRRAA